MSGGVKVYIWLCQNKPACLSHTPWGEMAGHGSVSQVCLRKVWHQMQTERGVLSASDCRAVKIISCSGLKENHKLACSSLRCAPWTVVQFYVYGMTVLLKQWRDDSFNAWTYTWFWCIATAGMSWLHVGILSGWYIISTPGVQITQFASDM